MSRTSLLCHPSLEASSSAGESFRPSLFNTKDDFIERIGPFAVAAIYFGSFSLTPKDGSLSRQALFKLSFLNRHFLHPGGLRIVVDKQTAIFSGTVTNPILITMADILAHQIEGIEKVKDETKGREAGAGATNAGESVQFLFATDQTLRSGVRVNSRENKVTLEGEVSSPAQKNWALMLTHAVSNDVESKLKVGFTTLAPAAEPPPIDDESLQALVLFRLRLVRETEHVPVKVKATRGIVSLQGKVRTEALRQRAENIARSTLGVRELRSTLSIAG